MTPDFLSRACTLLLAVLLAQPFAWAQDGQDETEEAFSQAELDQMMAPVALYPDSLLSQILMASTYPEDVKEAAQWSRANADQNGDAAVEAVSNEPWDPSVASLVAFPQVLEMMGAKPDWVKSMGDAFLADPESVMTTVQTLRKKAKEEGNLETTEQQTVKTEEQTIIIEPADPQVIYVPAYDPVVVYGTWWWPHYPPYYYPPPPRYGFGAGLAAGIGFGVGIAITNCVWGGFNWGRHEVNINVNRYNNINVNKRLDVNKKNVSWKHNSVNRRDVPYRDAKTQNKYGGKLEGSAKRNDYRGRDAERDKALSALRKEGMDPASGRQDLRGSGGDRARNEIEGIDRQRERSGPSSRSSSSRDLSDRSSSGRSSPERGSSERSRPSHSESARGGRSSHALSGVGSSSSHKHEKRGHSSGRSRGGRTGGRRRR